VHEHVDRLALEKASVEIMDMNCGAGERFGKMALDSR
jgi:hypothetical protein